MKRIRDSKFFVWIRTHKKIVIPAFIVVIILLLVLRPKPVVPVETEEVKRGTLLQSVSATGNITAEKKVDLKFLTSAKLVYVGVKKGDTVKKGTLIASQDQRAVQKTLENYLRDYSKQRNTFEQVKDDHGGSVPQTEANKAIRRILENNQWDLEKSVASVELQTLVKEQSMLISPIDGIVTQADATVAGVNVTPTTIYTIADPGSLIFQIEVDEADIGKIKNGQLIKLTLDAFSEEEYTGEVSSIDFASHTTTTGGTVFNVESSLSDEKDNTFREGMNGDAEIILSEKPNVLLVPLVAVSNNNTVFVKTPQGFVKTPIKLGAKNDSEAEVLSGVKPGDAVALSPQDAEKQLVKSFPFMKNTQ